MPPGGDTRAYESPFFGSSPGAPPYGGDAPPPPQQAFGMGPGWAPPPGPHSGQAVPIRRGPSTGLLIVLAVVIALAASLFGSVGTYLLTRSSDGTDPSYSLGPPPNGATNRAPDSVAGVAARVLPSVVSLEVGNGSGGDGATGSGFLIKDGYVVTNNHVVAMAARGGEIQIQFHNRKTTRGRIVGRDPGSDLAVVKPEETFGTPEITLGNSDQVVVGDPVIAVGSPLGLSARSPRASSARSTARSSRATRAAPPRSPPTSAPSRPMPPSTRATPAARWSTARARSSGSTPPSPR